jgi:peptidoglycan/LPS O-acetylase OafA/YrhL
LKNITPSRTRNAYPLTSVRFFLALLIVCHHSTPFFFPGLNGSYLGRNYLIQLMLSQTFSVSFFFLLSGYVLSMVYLRGGRGIEKAKFFAARFARLYPLYFVMIVLETPKVLSEKIYQHGLLDGLQKTAGIVGGHLLMLQGWTTRVGAMDAPAWTLSAEVFFYLCFPMLGVLLWKLRGRRLWLTAVGVYVGGQALSCAVLPYVTLKTFNSSPLLHLSTFALGILLARWQTLRQAREDYTAPRVWHINLVLLLSIAGTVSSVGIVARLYGLHGALSPFFMGIIWSLSARPTTLSKLLSTSWLVALGNASYAIYLIHYPLLELLGSLHWCQLAMFPVFFVVCIGLSLLSFYYFETPVRHWLMAWFDARSSRASVAS